MKNHFKIVTIGFSKFKNRKWGGTPRSAKDESLMPLKWLGAIKQHLTKRRSFGMIIWNRSSSFVRNLVHTNRTYYPTNLTLWTRWNRQNMKTKSPWSKICLIENRLKALLRSKCLRNFKKLHWSSRKLHRSSKHQNSSIFW